MVSVFFYSFSLHFVQHLFCYFYGFVAAGSMSLGTPIECIAYIENLVCVIKREMCKQDTATTHQNPQHKKKEKYANGKKRKLVYVHILNFFFIHILCLKIYRNDWMNEENKLDKRDHWMHIQFNRQFCIGYGRMGLRAKMKTAWRKAWHCSALLSTVKDCHSIMPSVTVAVNAMELSAFSISTWCAHNWFIIHEILAKSKVCTSSVITAQSLTRQ